MEQSASAAGPPFMTLSDPPYRGAARRAQL